MEKYKEITVIIPAIDFNNYLINCIEKIYDISKSINVTVLLDKYCEEIEHYKKKFLNLKFYVHNDEKLKISKKRNIGVQNCSTKYIAFIDSDAYPHKNWLKKSIEILDNNPEIYVVGGPNISPNDQSIEKAIIGEVSKSYLISGPWSFQKRISKSRFCENLMSVNMVMLKSTFTNHGGMNELLDAGEDYDFCTKINDNKKRIYFDQDVIVYHYDRGIKNFFIQKLVRGATVSGQISIKSEAFKKKPFQFLFNYLVPMYFVIFACISLLFFFNDFFNFFLLKNFISIIFSLYFSFIIVSLIFINKKNFLLFPIIFLFVILGNLSIGLGSILYFLKFTNIFQYYKNF